MTTLLVAATGGHLKQLHLLHQRLGLDGPFHWVTFDRPQSRSLLLDRGARVDFVAPIGSRDPIRTIAGLREARRIIATVRPTTVVSTGSAIALPYIALGRLRSIRCRYVESAARADGPSMTGRMVSRIPGVELQTQYASWADDRWRHREAVFDVFEALDVEVRKPVLRVLVTLGTLRFDFSRLVTRLDAVLPADVETVWQLGETPAPRGVAHAETFMSAQALTDAMQWADVIVAHAGVGSALSALEVGRVPVLVPRRGEHGEHIDDHQEQIARELAARGLAVHVEATALTFEHLAEAARKQVALAAG